MNKEVIDKYIIDAEKTMVVLNNEFEDFLHMQAGILSECGEVLDIFKKAFAYGKEVDRQKLCLELGDVAWYFANICNIFKDKNFNLYISKDEFYYYKNDLVHTLDNSRSHKAFIIITRNVMSLFLRFTQKPRSEKRFRKAWLEYCRLCVCCGFTVEEVLEKNIEKLKIRFEGKEFNPFLAINKNAIKEEKKVYEGERRKT